MQAAGDIDLTELSFVAKQNAGQSLIIPSLSMIFAVDDPFIVIDFEDFYSGVSFPSNFGTGVLTYASSSGDQFGLSNFSGYDMVVPSGYASGDPLSFEMIFNSTDLATLGATPGVYDWTWGTGTPNADFFRLCVGSPCPSSRQRYRLKQDHSFGRITGPRNRASRLSGWSPPAVPPSEGQSRLGIKVTASAKEPLGGVLPALLKPLDCLGLWTVLSGESPSGHALLSVARAALWRPDFTTAPKPPRLFRGGNAGCGMSARPLSSRTGGASSASGSRTM